MPQDFNPNILFGVLQTGFEISLGAAQKSLEIARNPQDNAAKLISEMQTMLTVPEHSGPELPGQSAGDGRHVAAKGSDPPGGIQDGGCEVHGREIAAHFLDFHYVFGLPLRR